MTRADGPLPDGPLAGARVVSLAVNVPGPVAAARLAGLGAAVTKVEPPAGDPLAAIAPAWYAALAAGQAVVRLDLKDADARAALHAHLAHADVLLTATRPAALARLGLDWPALHARHPRLCHVRVVGEAGARADVAGHDLTYQAGFGLLDPPRLPRTLLADLAAAERAVSAALALLLARARGGAHGGAGGLAEVGIADAARVFADPLAHGATAPGGPLGGARPTYALYAAAEGWVAVAALEPHFAARLAEALGVPLTRDALAAAFRARTATEWAAWAEARDLPIAAVA